MLSDRMKIRKNPPSDLSENKRKLSAYDYCYDSDKKETCVNYI